MKGTPLISVFAGILLLLFVAVPVSADPAITTISPAVGYLGDSTTVTITGTGFNETSTPSVKLMMDDESNITATVSNYTSTEIICKFTISSSKETGDWDLVVIDYAGYEPIVSGGFAIRDTMSLTSITPESARTNNDSVDITIAGSGLTYVESFYLHNDDYGNISGTNLDVDSSTEITGSFDLTDADIDTYEVCVMDEYGTVECDLEFAVLSDEVGNIDISSSPTGAAIYVDSEYKGVTPDSVEDLDAGSHKVILKKSGYEEWAKMVKVTAGDTTSVDADLEEVEATVTATPIPTTVRITTATLPPTTVKSTKTVPTPWSAATTAPATTTPESPVDTLIVIGAAGLGLLVLKHNKK